MSAPSTRPNTLPLRPVLVGPISSWEDVRQAFQTQLAQLQHHIASNWNPNNAGGRRITDVGNPQQMNDAVNLGYLHSVLLPGIYSQAAQSTQNIITSSAGTIDTYYNVPIGTATISGTVVSTASLNLFHGNVQVVTLTTNVLVFGPGGALNSQWRLITRENAVGGWSAILFSGFAFNGQAACGPSSPALTQCVSQWGKVAFGSSGLIAAPVLDQPIP